MTGDSIQRWSGLTLLALFVLFDPGWVEGAQSILNVHEWGTFTVLQNDSGQALPGINVEDEPLPGFCHNLVPWIFRSANSTPAFLEKGLPPRYASVTLRLETPVIYFHPPADQVLPFSIDVEVKLHGGWLTEFYPQAEPDLPGLRKGHFTLGPISADTVGRLRWRGVDVGTSRPGPRTTERVWLAPRDVDAADLTVPPQTSNDRQEENERYLFYRGVGHRPVPLRVSVDTARQSISLHAQCADVLSAHQTFRVDRLWLVHIRRDGLLAFRSAGPIALTHDEAPRLAELSYSFAAADYSAANQALLRDSMHEALTEAGLFPDEATAMLKTWQRAYLQSPGLRLFFLVPRGWTDVVLPLRLSKPAEIQRVMMGRIELFSPEQRKLLSVLESLPPSDPSWFRRLKDTDRVRRFLAGRSDFGDLGVAIPRDYQTYLDLGRFRTPLVLAYERLHPTPALIRFIANYGLAMTVEPSAKPAGAPPVIAARR